MLDALIEWDRGAMVALNLSGSHTAFWDSFFWMVSDILVWAPVLVAFFYAVIRSKKKESIYIFLVVVLLFVLCDQVSSSLLKPHIARLRPSRDPMVMQLLSYVHEYRGGQFGFPSSHAANSFGFMVLSSLLFRNRVYTVCAAFWALLCSYSRIYLGVHFPLDICCGTLLGVLLGFLCYYLLRVYLRRHPVDVKPLAGERLSESGYSVKDIHTVLMVLAIVLFTIICCAKRF